MASDPFYVPDPSGVAPPRRRGHPWLGRVLHLLLPACCLGCGQPLPVSAPLALCIACRGRLAPLPPERCAVCSGPPQGFAPPDRRCAACREHPPAFDRLLALWLYREPLDAVVQALKFRRLDYLGGHLAAALAGGLSGELAGCDGVVAVPLHWRRRLARGYNQAERIARPLAGRLDVPLIPALRRRLPTPPQTSLGRTARRENLRQAFRVPRPERIRGLHLLLVDDVATTGATLEEAAAALRRAGAEAVTAVVAARTPAKG